VAVSAVITNSGNLQGSFEATLKMDGADTGKQIVSLSANRNQIIIFNIYPSGPGTHTLSLGNLSAKLVVKEPPKANFVTTNISISKPEVNVGDTVTIGALVTNSGNASGTYTAILKIDGVIDQMKEIILGAEASQTVSFEVLKLNSGSYLAEFDGLSVPLTVIQPAPTPTVSPSPTAVAEFSLSLLAEIIGGAIVLTFITAFLLILRRRQLLKNEQNH
jgi:hypothetical protein